MYLLLFFLKKCSYPLRSNLPLCRYSANAFRRDSAKAFHRDSAKAFRRDSAKAFRRDSANAFRSDSVKQGLRGSGRSFS